MADSLKGDSFRSERFLMVEHQLVARGIRDAHLLEAMRIVPRHLFVPPHLIPQAYADSALPIGQGQTISQPYVVALMTELATLEPGKRVLEIGTGSGYQAALLAEMGMEVYSIERLALLTQEAEKRLKQFGYLEQVHLRTGDGSLGWKEEAPFDAILVTAAAPHLPEALTEQLAKGGKLIIPVGETFFQELLCCTRLPSGELDSRRVEAVAFVPLIGEEGWPQG